MDDITERAGVTVISRGSFVPPGRKLELGERKLFLLIEGPNEMSVKFAKMEIQRALEEETLKIGASATTGSFGRYSVT
jgi:ATP-dependent RNA helicase DDX46/PRP5